MSKRNNKKFRIVNEHDAQRRNKTRDIERRKNRKNKINRVEFEIDRTEEKL